jgi:hypothetical protein
MGVRGRQLIKEVMQNDILEISKHMSIEHLMDMYGLCLPNYFKQTVFDMLERYMGKGDITFQELFEITHKDFICCVTNISSNIPEYHSHKSTPHYKVLDSIAASMCVPLLFSPCIINGQCYVDGGMSDNCPFRVFPIENTLIFYLDGWKCDTNMSSFQQYIVHLAFCLWMTLDRNNFKSISAPNQKRILKLNIEGISFLDFRIGLESKKALVMKGVLEMSKVLNPVGMALEITKLLIKIICYLTLEKRFEEINLLS